MNLFKGLESAADILVLKICVGCTQIYLVYTYSDTSSLTGGSRFNGASVEYSVFY